VRGFGNVPEKWRDCGVLLEISNTSHRKPQKTNNKTKQKQKQTTNNKQQTTNNKQQTTNNKQQTTNNKQQTTNNKQQQQQKKIKRREETTKENKIIFSSSLANTRKNDGYVSQFTQTTETLSLGDFTMSAWSASIPTSAGNERTPFFLSAASKLRSAATPTSPHAPQLMLIPGSPNPRLKKK
jgi:hypothetical protein